MLKTSVIIFLFISASAFGQLKDFKHFSLSDKNSFVSLKQNKRSLIEHSFLDSNKTVSVDKIQTRTKKSPGLAMIYSLFIPGMGQLYTKRFDVGKYFLISEATLWLGYASFTVYSNWLLNDAYNYSVTHAGVTKGSKAKDDNFWVNIANYDNVEEYNNDMLEQGNYDKVYYPGTGFDFFWDNVNNREIYRSDKLAGDRIHNDRLFIVGAVILNHLISAISAIILTNKYNSGSRESGGVALQADVIKNFNHVDGIKLSLIKWF
jgi:hypothetical protein